MTQQALVTPQALMTHQAAQHMATVDQQCALMTQQAAAESVSTG
jgi:hypothetical protein